MMKWIGLTGGIGSGKSTVAQLLRDRGYPVVDADRLAHAVVQKGTEGLEKVITAFGPEYLTAEGQLDRARLGRWVFSRPEELKKLEEILHPLVQDETRRQKRAAELSSVPLAFYDVPLLFEKNLKFQFDAVVVVWCREDQQVARAQARGGLDEVEIRRRMSSQMGLDEKRARADFVIDNSGGPEALSREVDRVIEQLLKSDLA